MLIHVASNPTLNVHRETRSHVQKQHSAYRGQCCQAASSGMRLCALAEKDKTSPSAGSAARAKRKAGSNLLCHSGD